jgi:peptidyl-prolyl cis-trans isomerase D
MDQVSGVIESAMGYHILKVTGYQPGVVKTLDDVRGQIEKEIRQQLAAARFSDMAGQLTKLVYDQRDSLQPAADALGLTLREASGITRAGLLAEGQASPDAALLDNPRVRQVLFSPEVLRDKNNSGVIELSSGAMLAARVLEAKPAHVPPLADLRDSIRERLIAQRAGEAARAAGEAALKSLQESAASDAAREGFGESITVSRQQPQGLTPPLLESIMRMAPGKDGKPVYAGVASGADYTLVRLAGVTPGVLTEQQRGILSSELSTAWGQAEAAALALALRQQYGAKILPEAAEVLKPESAAGGS